MPKKIAPMVKLSTTTITTARYLLDFLLEMGSLFPQPFETPHSHRRQLSGWSNFPPNRVRQEINRFKKRGWIEESEKQGKKFLKLTRKGRLQTLYKKLQTINIQKQKRWDGKLRMAMFDIPEKGRHERNTIRNALTSTGFKQLQKSIYVYPYEIPGDIIAYLKEANLLPFIRFARVEKIDNLDDIKKQFKL